MTLIPLFFISVRSNEMSKKQYRRPCLSDNRQLLLLLLFLLMISCSAANRNMRDGTVQDPAQEELRGDILAEKKLGIDITGIRLSAAGYMLDFRYVVDNPEQAGAMFDRNTIPYLVHEKSGAKFSVPSPAKVGPLRATTGKPESGRRYYIFFANPGRYVKAGDLVTVVMGEHEFRHLAVD